MDSKPTDRPTSRDDWSKVPPNQLPKPGSNGFFLEQRQGSAGGGATATTSCAAGPPPRDGRGRGRREREAAQRVRRPLPLPPGLPRRVRPQLEGLPSTCSSLESM
ncbi:hypothetical protein VPH35_015275 [Triticum aestivum]